MFISSEKNKMTCSVFVPDQIKTSEILDLLARVYGPTYKEAYGIFTLAFQMEPSLCPKNFVLARDQDGNLIGIVRIVEREIWVDGLSLKCGGISSVAVVTRWQKHGVCTRMMKRAIKEMICRGFDISFLHGRKVLDGFYTRFGYRGIGRYVDLRLLNFQSGTAALKTRKYNRCYEDFCRRAYQRTYRCLTGSLNRDLKVWRWLFNRIERGSLPAVITMVMGADAPVGYLIVKDNKLVELCVPAKFFMAVNEWVHKQKLESISIHPHHPFFIYCRRYCNTILQERMPLNGGYMARVIRNDLRLSKLVPRLFLDKGHSVAHRLPAISWVKDIFPDLCFHTSALDEV